jgi:hypothetical protein
VVTRFARPARSHVLGTTFLTLLCVKGRPLPSQNVGPFEVALRPEGGDSLLRQRHLSGAPALRRSLASVPEGPPDDEAASHKVHVLPLEGEKLSDAEPRQDGRDR